MVSLFLKLGRLSSMAGGFGSRLQRFEQHGYGSAATGLGSLKLSLQSVNCCRQRSFSVTVPLQPRLWSLSSRRLEVRASEETDVDSKEAVRVKRERLPFSEYALLLELREFQD